MTELAPSLVELAGRFGIATDYFGGTWRGNVWDDNLGTVCITGRSSGCE